MFKGVYEGWVGYGLEIASSSIGTTTLSWVSVCSTIVEHSQQESFTECRCQRHVKPPTWRRTRDLESSNFLHKRPPASEATLAKPAAEGGTMGEKWPRILPKVATFTSLFGSFTYGLETACNLFMTVKHNTEVNYPDYRMSLLNICFRQHVSAVKRPSSGLYRASHVKYNELGTQWNPTVFTIILQ
jgi:hypothetical protein